MTVRRRVIGPRLLVKQLEPSEVRVAGIVLPKQVGSDEVRGVVVDVGAPWDGSREPPASEGDVVVWDDRVRGAEAPVRVTIVNEDLHVPEEFVVLYWTQVLVVLEEVPAEVPR